MDDPYAKVRIRIAEWDLAHRPVSTIIERNPEIDWATAKNRDFNYDWLVEKWWPIETQMHVFASAKTGKSLLMLWIAANLAIGRDPFSWAPIKRQSVVYLDNEMTERDVIERVTDMGIEFDELVGWLHYVQHPAVRPMDTELGGIDTLELVQAYGSNVLIIDTLSRVVKGEENSNDTYRNFYNCTGRLLKANAIALARLDHAGYAGTHSRGASAKVDDVDLVYSLEKRATKDDSPGYRLTRTHARVSNCAEIIELQLSEEPLSVKSTQLRSWNEQAIRKARELDEIGAPLDVSQREAIRLLKAADIAPGKTTFLAEALRLRISRDDFRQFNL